MTSPVEGAHMITVTDIAKEKVKQASEAQGRAGDGLRVAVQNGGTSMAEFSLQFISDAEIGETDRVIDAGPFKVVVDADSVAFMEGATIDYIDGLTESGFKVDAPNASPARPTGDLADRVQQVIESKINPSIASHGGFVTLEGLRDNVAYLRFGGGCQGCGMINVTLKQGVEVAIREDVPEITAVMDVTDHANGTNPYFRPGK